MLGKKWIIFALLVAITWFITSCGMYKSEEPNPKQANRAAGLPVEFKVAAVTASGDDGNIPDNTIDKIMNTRWSAKGRDQWIMFDLGEEKTIRLVKIAVYQGNTRSSFFEIELSKDKVQFEKVFTGQSSGKSLELETFDIQDGDARYVRILGHGSSGGSQWNSLTEVKIYGSDENNPPKDEIAVPEQPKALIAEASSGTVQLSWDAVPEAEGYNIRRSISKEEDFITIASGIYDSTFIDKSVTNGVTYDYKLSAVNMAGEGESTAPTEVEVTLQLDTTALAASSQMQKVQFYSESLQKNMRFNIYLPKGYTNEQQYPVAYLYHGFAGNEDNWMPTSRIDKTADELIEAGKIEPIIIVAPQADNSFGLNTSNRPAHPFDPDYPSYSLYVGRYEDYIVNDVIAYTESHFSTIASREGRYIGGMSMGGFVSLHTAFKHPDKFSKALGHSPTTFADDFSYVGADLEPWLHPNDNTYVERDLLKLAANRDLSGLDVYLNCGDDDELGYYVGAEALHQLLVSRGVKSQYHHGPGGHDLAYTLQNIDKHLLFFAGVDSSQEDPPLETLYE